MLESANPITIFFSWQALVLALAVSGTVHFIKTVLDAKMGVEKRKANTMVTRVVLPVLGLAVGVVYANLVPVRPEVIIEYVVTHKSTWGHPWAGEVATYGAWGAGVGQFADYVFTKVKRLLEDSEITAS